MNSYYGSNCTLLELKPGITGRSAQLVTKFKLYLTGIETAYSVATI